MLNWFEEMKQPEKPWIRLTSTNISDFVYHLVGDARSPGRLVDEVIKQKKWDTAVEAKDFLHVLPLFLPAEYQLQVHALMQNESLLSRFHRILVRVCWSSSFDHDFRINGGALGAHRFLQGRHLCEREVSVQTRTFRALSELYIYGGRVHDFASMYTINIAQVRALVEWVLENITVAEAKAWSWFFNILGEVDNASYPTITNGDSTPVHLPRFWRTDLSLATYLQAVLDKFKCCNLQVELKVSYDSDKTERSMFSKKNAEFRAGFFLTVFVSTNFLHDAELKLHKDFADQTALQVAYEDFVWLLSPALRAIADQRCPFVTRPDREHKLGDDLVVIVLHWDAITSEVFLSGDRKAGIDVCNKISVNEGRMQHEKMTHLFCEPAIVPPRLRLLELLLDVTDWTKACKQVAEKYGCSLEDISTIMRFVESFRPNMHEKDTWDPIHFDIQRKGLVDAHAVAKNGEERAEEPENHQKNEGGLEGGGISG
jgi:hypothetical protein